MRGFTLVELIITLAIAVTLLSVGVPQAQRFIASSRLSTQANDVVLAMNLARNEAGKRQRLAFVESLSGSTSWTQGWQVRVDSNDNNTLDADDETIRVFSPLGGNVTLTGPANACQFQPSGWIDATRTFTLRNSDGYGRDIALSRTGRPSVTKTTGSP